MNKKVDHYAQLKTKLYLLLIILSFIGPLILATIMYKYNEHFPVASPKSYGNLINPVITINKEDNFNNILSEKKWTLMYLYENNSCDLLCEATLYMMHQVRESLGKDKQRVSNIIVTNTNFNNHNNKNIVKKYEKLKQLDLINKNLFKSLEKNYLYVIDPLGNIFMYYDKDFNAKGLKKDIKKILKISRIG
tara:strand:+ start:94 stop:666 length:573 start_codon:yes stop_codon:yes gene_type:complete